MKPKISVILPVYNAKEYIKETLESVLTQTFSDFEVLIMDDGSTDGTSEILKTFAAKDHRIKLFHQENKGVVSSYISLIEKAESNLLARMDADDFCYPERFAKQYEYLTKHPDTVMVSAFCKIFYEKNERAPRNTGFTADFMNRWFLSMNPPFIHSMAMFKKDAYQISGGYLKEEYPAEDYGLWVRIKRHGKIMNLPEILGEYRLKGSGVSGKNFKQQIHIRNVINIKNLDDIYAHNEIPEVKDILPELKLHGLTPRENSVIGQLAALTGCYLACKGQGKKARTYFKLALKLDKKRICDALPNILLSFFRISYLVSLDVFLINKIFLLKIRWFLPGTTKYAI